MAISSSRTIATTRARELKIQIVADLPGEAFEFVRVISENLADDMEHHAGIESLLGWIKRNCLPQLEETKNWPAFHNILNENGLQIRERGNGFIISDSKGLAVKASSISRSMSKNKLKKRLGKFESIESNFSNHENKRHYEQRPINRRINTVELFAKYQAEQKNNKATISDALATTRSRKNSLIEQAKRQGRLKRAAIKGQKTNKKILYTLINKTLQSNINIIRKQYDKERQTIFDKFPRNTWADWLQKQAFLGDRVALSILRCREFRNSKNSNLITGKKESDTNPISSFKIDNITKEGTIIYRVGSCSIRDHGDFFKISKALSKEYLIAAIKMAQQRFGQCIKVDGSELFKKAIVQTAAYFKLNLTFDDANLEKQRQELIIQSTSKEKSLEPTRPFNHRTTIGRNRL